jgi:hypothetical protein
VEENRTTEAVNSIAPSSGTHYDSIGYFRIPKHVPTNFEHPSHEATVSLPLLLVTLARGDEGQ